MQDKRKEAYIQALTKLLRENPDAASTYVDSFVEALRERGEEKLIAPVLSAVKVNLREGGNLLGHITLGDETPETREAALEDAKTLGIGEDTIAVSSDSNLIGGYRIVSKSTLIDSSFKNALLTLYKSLTR